MAGLHKGVSLIADIPFELIHDAMEAIKSLLKETEGPSWSALLLLTGVFRDSASDLCMLLSWSPLHGAIPPHLEGNEFPSIARQWLLDRVSEGVTFLNERSKELWKLAWPPRCLNYLTRGILKFQNQEMSFPDLTSYLGFCKKQRDGECERLHKFFSASDCFKKVEVCLLNDGQISDWN